MRRGLLIGTILVALFGVVLYRVSPKYPKGFEDYTLFDKFHNAISISLYKLLLTLENYGLIDDCAVALRKIVHLVYPYADYLFLHYDVVVEHDVVDNIPVTIFRPPHAVNSKSPFGALIYFHGGGYFFCNPSTHFLWTKKLALEGDVVVISVDYRLAPEHPFPAAIDDGLKVTKAVFDNAEKFKIDPSRILVGGESAGGHLAAVVAVELALSDKYRLKGQVLLSPHLQGIEYLPSHKSFAWYIPYPFGCFIAKLAGLPYSFGIHSAAIAGHHLTSEDKERYAQFLNMSALSDDIKELLMLDDEHVHNLEEPTHPLELLSVEEKESLERLRELAVNERAWPLLTTDNEKLRRLCPTFLSVAQFDPLRDEALLYYHRLRSLGVPVSMSYMIGVGHARPVVSVVTFRAYSENLETKYIPDIIKFIKDQTQVENNT